MPVYSPPGAPNIVYIGGAMQYSEIGGRSNGRAVQRSEDAGVNFTDMTIDTQGVSRHPDQHAMAATPFNPNIVFNGRRRRRLEARTARSPTCPASARRAGLTRQQPDRLQ